MEEEPTFCYTGSTPQHSLNMVVTEPRVIKELKAFCEKHKRQPVAISSAVYTFTYDGFAKTFYRVYVETQPAKQAKNAVARWAKKAKFPWVFGEAQISQLP